MSESNICEVNDCKLIKIDGMKLCIRHYKSYYCRGCSERICKKMWKKDKLCPFCDPKLDKMIETPISELKKHRCTREFGVVCEAMEIADILNKKLPLCLVNLVIKFTNLPI